MGTSGFERQAREMNATARLGGAVSAPVPFHPLPLKFYAGSILLLVCGLAALVGAVVTELRVPGLMVGAVLLAAGSVPLLRRALDRGTLELHDHGVVVTRSGRRAVLSFDELDRLRIEQKEQQQNGVRVGLVRRIRIASGRERAAFASFSGDGEPDTFGPVIAGLLRGAAEATSTRIRAGWTLRGRGWSLDTQGLRVGRGEPIPLSELSAVGVHQERVCIWRAEERDPLLTTEAGSENALLLSGVIASGLEGKPEREVPGLGRVIFEKGNPRAVVVATALIGAALLLGSVLVFREERILGVGLALVGLALVVLAAVVSRSRFRAYERGLVREGILGTRTLSYAEIDRMAFSATRQYTNGVYTGTTLSLKCVSPAGARLGFQTTVRGQDAGLDGLRDHIAAVVARRMYERLRSEGEVAWAGGARITREGVRFRRKKILGAGEETFVRWADLRFAVEGGTFRLVEPGQKKATFEIPCSAENFYPGFVLFETLPAEETQAASTPD